MTHSVQCNELTLYSLKNDLVSIFLVTICHHKNYTKVFCFLVMRTFKIHSTGNFQTCPTKSSTIITILHLHPWFIHLQRQLCTSQPPPLILPIPNTPPPQASLISLDAWDLGVLFICFVFYIPDISETIWYLSFSVWLISLSILPSYLA